VTPGELDDTLRRHGAKPVERCGVILNPVTMQWSIGSDVSASYLQFHRIENPAAPCLDTLVGSMA
jgi:hypothetical protein